jgi:hypothetical protein
LTTQHQAELDVLLEELVDRAEKNRSTLSIVALRGLHHRGDLQALRFHHRHWDASTTSRTGISFSVSSVTYKAAQLIGKEDPNSFVTEDHFAMVRRLWDACDMRKLRCSRTIDLAPYMALVLGNLELEQLLVSLLVDRGITSVDELREILEGADRIPMVMNGGVL